MRRLICASSSVASLRPASIAKPAAPMNAFWMLTFSNSPSPSGPTRLSASQRRKPAGMTTLMPGWPANSEAIRRPFVITVRWSQPPRPLRCRARASAVVLASRAMLSPSTTMPAATRPIASFSSGWIRSRTSNARSAPARPSVTAPPCVRTTRPCRSRTARSLRIVTPETRNVDARSATRARPCSSTMRAMWSCRSSANTSPRPGVVITESLASVVRCRGGCDFAR